MTNEDILLERQEVVGGFFKEVDSQKDPRIDRCKDFTLSEIFFVVLCAQICGYETLREYEAYGDIKIDFLRQFLPYEKGAPSRSTISRVLALFDPQITEQLFIQLMQKVVSQPEELSEQDCTQNVLAIDGKTHRGAQEELHLVSAFDTRNGLVLGQQKVPNKSNEITAIPLLLDSLAIQGHLVSIDAIGCQKTIAEKIISKKANYLLALKGNQGVLCEEVKDFFENKDCIKTCATVTRLDKGHGRIEKRTCYATNNIDWISKKADWKGLKSIVMIISERTIKGKTTVEKRFYITSIDPNPSRLLGATRAHWGVENSLHWVLDVIFGEDARILWNQNIAQNEAIIRKIALNLLKAYRLIRPTKSVRSEKIGIKTLRKVLTIADEEMFKLLHVNF